MAAREEVLARRCAALLEDAGLPGSLLDFEPGRSQYVARAGSDAPLTFTGHLDTVPATPSDWSVDPWAASADGDRLVGRGTSDMKSGVAALVVAVADHVRRTHACRGVQVVLTSGEETGCDGALAIPASALAAGGPLVVAEPTANRLVPAHKGAHWMRLTAKGKAAHGSAPELGDNAVVRLARSAVALHDFDGWPTQDGFGRVTANVGAAAGRRAAQRRPRLGGAAARRPHRALGVRRRGPGPGAVPGGRGRPGRRPRRAAAGGHLARRRVPRAGGRGAGGHRPGRRAGRACALLHRRVRPHPVAVRGRGPSRR